MANGPSGNRERTAWRQWASLGESVLSSFLVIGAVVGGALSTVVMVGQNGKMAAQFQGILLCERRIRIRMPAGVVAGGAGGETAGGAIEKAAGVLDGLVARER